jgi:hypothetical protein
MKFAHVATPNHRSANAADATILEVSSLALIGNASEQTLGAERILMRGVFDKETRRKPLAFAADAVRYGI